jgi:flagellar basal body-associated protein FliL
MDQQPQNIGQPGVQPSPQPTPQPVPQPSIEPPVPPQLVAQPVFTPPPKPGKKKKIIGIILGVVGLLIIVSAVLLYFVWWQSPNKMVTDALLSVVTAEKMNNTGTLVIEAPSSDVKMTITTKGTTNNGALSGDATVKLEVEALDEDVVFDVHGVASDDGVLYVKIDKLRETVDTVIDAIIKQQTQQYRDQGMTESDIAQVEDVAKQQVSSMFSLDTLIPKVDGQWIRIASDDLEDNEEAQCTADVMKDIQKDKEVTREVMAIYDANRFIQVKDKVDAKDGAPGFRLTGDRDKAQAFMSEFKKTETAGRLLKCDSTIFDSVDDALKETDSSSNADIDFVIWVDRFSHKLKSLQLDVTSKEDETKVSATYDFEIGQANEVVVPSDARDFKDVYDDITSSIQDSYGVNASTDEYYYDDYDFGVDSNTSTLQGV